MLFIDIDKNKHNFINAMLERANDHCYFLAPHKYALSINFKEILGKYP
jgi:hypothetical protein